MRKIKFKWNGRDLLDFEFISNVVVVVATVIVVALIILWFLL